MEASWRKFEGEDSYKSYKDWLGKVPVFQEEFATHVKKLLRMQNSNNPDALFALGDAFAGGYGIERDPDLSIRYYCDAANAGHVKAMVRFGRLLLREECSETKLLAISWFKKAADGGYSGGMVALGFVYRDAQGVPFNPIKAAEWFAKAVEAGDESAKIILAKVYYFSMGDTDKALPLLLDEASRGNSDSFKILGRIYGDTRTRFYDFEKAVYWYEQVMNGKHQGPANGARIALAELHLEGKQQPKNIVKAREYLDAVLSNAPEKHTLRKEALKLLGKIDKGKV